MLARRVAEYMAVTGSEALWGDGSEGVQAAAAPDALWHREPVLLDPCVVLPQELVTLVLSLLPPTEVLRARCVSKVWAVRCTDEALWRGFVCSLASEAHAPSTQPRPWSWMFVYFARTSCRNTASLMDAVGGSIIRRYRCQRDNFDPDWDDDGEV